MSHGKAKIQKFVITELLCKSNPLNQLGNVKVLPSQLWCGNLCQLLKQTHQKFIIPQKSPTHL